MLRRSGSPGRRSRQPRRFLSTAAAALLAVSLSGCSLLGGSETASGGNDKVEKAKITLGVMKAIDVAPVHLAIKEGYFRAEGLEVELKTINGGADAVPLLSTGGLDISFGNWISFFQAHAKKALDLRIVGDAYQARPGMFMVLTRPGSGIDGPKQLAGKTVAVNTRNNVNELTLRSVLEANDVKSDQVKFTEMGFPDMPAALANKSVDAASVIEPYATQAQRKTGAAVVMDSMTGPTAELPIAGYVSSAKFAQENPKTVKAFQRALKKAQAEAQADRKKVEAQLVEQLKMEEDDAKLVNLGTYPTTLEASRLQRVADLMKNYGVLTEPLDVKPLIVDEATN
ncbi:NitT/TauT family transport system substrate-binding protein [Streptoalloteichus tenebrarius]|uniref:NitT/TauT family transport system substrate-binding protein n=1 Tax=Streptoalloteichus tenebrarius (strain ATCC 17920 / DSM 40477 / JCM 4838 / CBS 697.72 / NBRC 16177 / NCIMB 11028 / NRRL B-12390 / A12253. 1 / ISP 5477) TaxID=1933 RepID=A0ABT1HVH0_STRSD|nr:ABC transporter substrate-binding protein [Streptoalloteichus tenebrarius]MCP2259491.1 NitT/TauT family transport system substrate-binding protein [Streptoalloteichus tenebrarius]BFF01429.1 ABC transporter substrate-binding protein [Streptoalloteichus tenebrarius]